jgi:hypothetical protein
MTIAVWPSQLPRPERSTWQSQAQDVRRERQNDTGPSLPGRARFSNAAKLVTLSVVLTHDQRSIFDNFFERDTRRGTLMFWMPDPTTDGWGLFDSDGQPLLIAGGSDDNAPILLASQWLCSFGKTTPSESIQGIEFRKSFNVMVMP